MISWFSGLIFPSDMWEKLVKINSEKAKKEVGLSGGMFPAWTHFVVAEPT